MMPIHVKSNLIECNLILNTSTWFFLCDGVFGVLQMLE